VKILLNSKKNISSVNADTYYNIELSNRISLLTEFEIDNTISAADVFDTERENSEVYRIYGELEYLSLLNGLNINYQHLSDFFLPVITNQKNIINSFDFYIVRPVNYIQNSSTDPYFVRNFEIIATPADFDLYTAGFSKNLFNEQRYAFNFTKDIDISIYFDEFGFPVTQLFLYAVYKQSINGYGTPESMTYTKFNTIDGSTTTSPLPFNIVPTNPVYGDLIQYDESNFIITGITDQTYYISTPYRDTDNVTPHSLSWAYNPFIPLNLRYFYDSLNYCNSGNTSNDRVTSIPSYATDLDGNGNFVWRDIIPQGLSDPNTNLGVNCPFINEINYFFSNQILAVIPNLNDPYTLNVFNQILLNNSNSLNYNPAVDLININAPCV